MQFILLPFALCFLLYIHQENRYRFWAATALKVTLILTLALCLAFHDGSMQVLSRHRALISTGGR